MRGPVVLNHSAGVAWRHDDGGRAAAGFKGQAGDCVTRAIAIATAKSYREVYDALHPLVRAENVRTVNRLVAKSRRIADPKRALRVLKKAKQVAKRTASARDGVSKSAYRPYLRALGWTWTPTMQIGSGCKVHLCADELPSGRIIAEVSRHIVAVIDGVIHDTYDPSRDGTRCVYGYWSKLDEKGGQAL